MAQRTMEYVGPVHHLQGKQAEVREICQADRDAMLGQIAENGIIMAQFDHTKGRWWPAPLVDFRPITDKPVF